MTFEPRLTLTLALTAITACSVDNNRALFKESDQAVKLARTQLAALTLEGTRVRSPLPEPDPDGPRIASAVYGLGLTEGENRITVRLPTADDRGGEGAPAVTALLVGVEPAPAHLRVGVPANNAEFDLIFETNAAIQARNDLLVLSLSLVDSEERAGPRVRVGLKVSGKGAMSTRRLIVLPSTDQSLTESAYVGDAVSSSVLALAQVKGKDNAFLAVGGRRADSGGTVAVWNLDAGRLVRRFDDHTAAVLSVAYEPTTGTLASGSADHTLRLRRVGTGELLATLGDHQDDVNAVTWSRDGKSLLSAGRDGRIVTRDPETGAPIEVLDTGLAINAASFGTGTFGVVAGDMFEAGHLRVYGTATKEATLSADFPEAATALAFSVDGARVAVAIGRGRLQVRDVASGDILVDLNGACLPGSTACAEQARELGTPDVPAPRDTVSAVAFGDAEAGSIIATSLVGTLAVWSIKAGRMTVGIELGTPVLSSRVSGDASTVAVGLYDGTTLVLTLAE